MHTMPPVSTLTAMPHPGSQHLLTLPWGQQQPQCALRVPETQNAQSWNCAFLKSPVSAPRAGKPCLRDRRQRGKDTGIPPVSGQETEGEASPLKQACLCTRSPGPRVVQGRMACPCGDLGTIGALCACLLGETPGCAPQPGTAAAGTMVTVPLNLHSAGLTSLPVCCYPVFRTYPTARVRAGRDEDWSQNHGHSLSQ